MFRIATQTYHVPNDSLTIPKGQKIVIPLHSLHYDPKYYTDPEVFNPERFSPEEKAKRPNGTYLPFGEGPRICIGMFIFNINCRVYFLFNDILFNFAGKRFAELEMKLALVEVLSKFEVETCEKTEVPLKFSKKSLILIPKNGIWLKFQPISS